MFSKQMTSNNTKDSVIKTEPLDQHILEQWQIQWYSMLKVKRNFPYFIDSCSSSPMASPYLLAASEYFCSLYNMLPFSFSRGILAIFSSSVKAQVSFSKDPTLSSFTSSVNTNKYTWQWTFHPINKLFILLEFLINLLPFLYTVRSIVNMYVWGKCRSLYNTTLKLRLKMIIQNEIWIFLNKYFLSDSSIWYHLHCYANWAKTSKIHVSIGTSTANFWSKFKPVAEFNMSID